MPDDDLRTYLARQSPWLALHDLRQEVQELRAMVERITSSPDGGVLLPTPTRADEQWQNVTGSRAWQELHEEGLHSLWPPREEAGGGGVVR